MNKPDFESVRSVEGRIMPNRGGKKWLGIHALSSAVADSSVHGC